MMSDNDIRKGFQSKLSGFESPVPPDGWESVEKSLKAASAARLALRRRWYSGSVAAVLVLLVGSLWFLRNQMDSTGTMVSETTPVPAIIETPQDAGEEMGKAPEVSSEPQVTPIERRLQDANKTRQVKSRKEPAIRAASPVQLLAMLLERDQSSERKIDTALLRLWAKPAKKDALQNGKGQKNEDEVILYAGEDILLAGGSASDNERSPLLLSIGGKGGLSSYQQTVNTPVTLRSASSAPEEKSLTENKIVQSYVANVAENTSEMMHSQPVSFGITVSKYLFEDLSIETGLVYSFLHSTSSNSNKNYQKDEVQNLHYLGIPLNVNYNILSFGGMNIYASVGGMIEKDIYGEFKRASEVQEEGLDNSAEEMKKEKISQKHPQFSVNAGVGLSYPIYDRLKLYGKIGGAYYFDANNAYKTIYSDRKVVMDLNVGLRYEF